MSTNMKKTNSRMIKKILALAMIAATIVTSALAPMSCQANGDPMKDACSKVGKNSAACDVLQKNGDQVDKVNSIISNVTTKLLFFVGVACVIMIIYSGVQYITSAGDTSKTKKATQTMIYAIVGLVIAVMAYAIIWFVLNNIMGVSLN